jgi:hypothetical protein
MRGCSDAPNVLVAAGDQRGLLAGCGRRGPGEGATLPGLASAQLALTLEARQRRSTHRQAGAAMSAASLALTGTRHRDSVPAT